MCIALLAVLVRTNVKSVLDHDNQPKPALLYNQAIVLLRFQQVLLNAEALLE